LSDLSLATLPMLPKIKIRVKNRPPRPRAREGSPPRAAQQVDPAAGGEPQARRVAPVPAGAQAPDDDFVSVASGTPTGSAAPSESEYETDREGSPPPVGQLPVGQENVDPEAPNNTDVVAVDGRPTTEQRQRVGRAKAVKIANAAAAVAAGLAVRVFVTDCS
jgi:hypothetical protein